MNWLIWLFLCDSLAVHDLSGLVKSKELINLDFLMQQLGSSWSPNLVKLKDMITSVSMWWHTSDAPLLVHGRALLMLLCRFMAKLCLMVVFKCDLYMQVEGQIMDEQFPLVLCAWLVTRVKMCFHGLWHEYLLIISHHCQIVKPLDEYFDIFCYHNGNCT
jgi:hypothetical protein